MRAFEHQSGFIRGRVKIKRLDGGFFLSVRLSVLFYNSPPSGISTWGLYMFLAGALTFAQHPGDGMRMTIIAIHKAPIQISKNTAFIPYTLKKKE